MSHSFYQKLAHSVNQTIGRTALSANKIDVMVKNAKRVRQQGGIQALIRYANELQEELFTPPEINRIQNASYWNDYANRMVGILIRKGIISPWEAQFLKRYI